MNPERNIAQSDLFLEQRLRHFPDTLEFAQSLLAGVRSERAKLDQRLAEMADNWSLQRMAVTDRNAIRLGMYEILHAGTPGPVAINEAVELAKRFGAAHSGQFVNGILDRFLQSPLSAVPDDTATSTSEDAKSSEDVEPRPSEDVGSSEDVEPEPLKRVGPGPLKRVWQLKRARPSEDPGPPEDPGPSE